MSEAMQPEFSMSREEFSQIHEEFRDLKHRLNNTLAIVMALSEMSQRNPSYSERLAQTVLLRGPETVSLLTQFQNRLAEKLGLPIESLDPGAPAPS
jgi:two-component sensor histidine kinase